MSYITGYKLVINHLTDYELKESETEGKKTWALYDGANLIVKAIDYKVGDLSKFTDEDKVRERHKNKVLFKDGNHPCSGLDHIVRFLKNPGFYEVLSTSERDDLSLSETDQKSIFNSDSKKLESWHVDKWF